MAKIDELLNELCPDGVEYVSLGSICNCITGGDTPKDCIKGQKEPTAEYPYPVYSNGDAVYGYCKTYRVDKAAVTVSSIGNVGTAFYRNPFFTPIIRLKTFIPNEDYLDVKFLYFCLSGIDFIGTNSSLSSMKAADFKKIQIPIPPLPIQQQIVEVLDTFTDAISNLEEELALREKQFEYYREQLFNFEEGEFEWRYIPELASYSTGLTYKPANVKDTGTLVLRSSNIKNNQLSYEDNVYVQMNIPERSKVQLHDILICVRNGSKNLVGKCAYISNLSSECAFGAFMNILRAYNINSKFLYYSWQLHSTINQYKGDDASPICQITNKDFARIRIKVPAEIRQQEIVEILDTFEAMIANIKEEIALRTKQYEYYREKLLSFGK